MTRISSIAAPLLALGLLVAACGDDDDGADVRDGDVEIIGDDGSGSGSGSGSSSGSASEPAE